MQSHSTARQSPKSGYQRETIGACARTIGLRTRISRRAGRAQDAALQPAGVSPALSVCHASFAFAARATARGTRASDAAPETIEASLQLSEAVLVDIGVPMGPGHRLDPREAGRVPQDPGRRRRAGAAALERAGRDGVNGVRARRP